MSRKQEISALHRLSLSSDWKKFDNILKRICYYEQDIYSDNALNMAQMVGARGVYIKIQKMIKEYNDGK